MSLAGVNAMHAATEMYGRERGVEEGRKMHQHCSAS